MNNNKKILSIKSQDVPLLSFLQRRAADLTLLLLKGNVNGDNSEGRIGLLVSLHLSSGHLSFSLFVFIP